MIGRDVSSWLSSDCFEAWEVELVAGLAGAFCRPGGSFSPDEFNDLVHECLLHWWKARKRPARNRRAFLKTVVRNKLRDLWRARQADRRRILDQAQSLDRPIEEGSGLTLADVLPAEPPGPTPDAELQSELEEVLPTLSARQRRICEMIASGHSIRAISKALGLHHSTTYGEIKRIRKIFTAAELQDYLD